MPIGGSKVGLFGAGTGDKNYFGDESLGDCQFGASAITQTGDSTAIDTVLTTGSESGGPGSSSYGTGVPYSTAIYETTVLNTSGTYDGDMWVGNFTNLTIDASVTLSTNRPCRGMLIYCSGNATINGALSMTARGGHSDPTTSGGGSPASAVSSTGLRIPLAGGPDGTETLAAADLAGAGTAAIAAVANHDAISGDGTIFTINKLGGVGGSGGPPGTVGAAGLTGAKTISAGGGASGRGNDGDGSTGQGGASGAFSGGASSGSCRHASSSAGGSYGGAGSAAGAGGSGEGIGGGVGNPGVTGYGTSGGQNDGVGGIIWLIVKGDITIGASGSIQGKGTVGPSANYYGGSGSGGGAIMICYAGTLTNNGTISANGGSGGGGIHGGHAGGHGGHFTAQVDE